MDGIQKTVAMGLRFLADKVELGRYGTDDNIFNDDASWDAFINDVQDDVFDKME